MNDQYSAPASSGSLGWEPFGTNSKSIAVAVAIVLIAGITTYAYWRYSEAQRGVQGALTAGSARLTFAADDGKSLSKVSRNPAPELWLRVALNEAPLGVSQKLRCEWVDPTGRLVRENRYETKVIDHLPWVTHARLQLRADAPLGMWRATLFRNEQKIWEQSFEVANE